MTQYVYVKESISSRRQRRKVISLILLSIGVVFLAAAFFPILLFQVQYSAKFNQVLNPLSSNQYNTYLYDNDNLSQLNNWFIPVASNSAIAQTNPSTALFYQIDIPTIKIREAKVALGNMDLKNNLVQYPQTAMPGQPGNTVIYGHSALPQFFNTKSYLTMFTPLFKLENNDEIFIKYDNVQYKYLVQDVYEVPPTELSVLDQRYDGRYLTLITCSPPGTTLRRLIIKAKIAQN